MDGLENVFEQLLVASDSSTLKESLERLIETAKAPDGRLDLACKRIVELVLTLLQSPRQLSAEDRFLSIKLLRNLCAGEIKNQDLFIQQNGVAIILNLIDSTGIASGSDDRTLYMVLQLLGNVSLAGEQHCHVVWCQMFPLRFLVIARVQSRETCDTLSMIIYTCVEGSNERSVELLGDAGRDIVVEIIRTVTTVGFKEHWVKSLLFKTCFQDSYLSPVFSKLSPLVEAENNSGTNAARLSSFGDEQALLLSILSEILNEHLGDIVAPLDVSLFLFGILRNAVGAVDFSTRGTSPLPTGSPDVDVMGYAMSLLRDISACQGPNIENRDEEKDVVDMLVEAGLIKFLIKLLRGLEPPAIVRKAMVHNDNNDDGSSQKQQCPYRGFRRDVVAIIGNCSYRRRHVQDEIREEDGILLLLQQSVTDEDNPFLREWGIWSMRNVFEGNEENQRLVEQLELQRSVDTAEIAELGLRVEVDPKTQRPKLVNAK